MSPLDDYNILSFDNARRHLLVETSVENLHDGVGYVGRIFKTINIRTKLQNVQVMFAKLGSDKEEDTDWFKES